MSRSCNLICIRNQQGRQLLKCSRNQPRPIARPGQKPTRFPYDFYLKPDAEDSSADPKIMTPSFRRRPAPRLSPFSHRDAGLTRHPGLAEATTIAFKVKALPAIVRPHLKEMIPAFVFVVAGFRNRPGWTALHAFPASVLGKMETIFMMIRIWPDRWRDRNPGHHRADAHGLAPGSDKSIAEPKSSQAGNMCGMPHGPAGGGAVTR